MVLENPGVLVELGVVNRMTGGATRAPGARVE